MAILTLDRKELEKIIGKITPQLEERLNMFGMPIENISETEFSVDITVNRPDLLSFQGYSRAILSFLGKKTGLREYNAKKPKKDYKVIIEKSVKKVWPCAVCAIVKNLEFDDKKIKEIIDIQEKLTTVIGRKRKKLGLGVYPLDKIKLPIIYTAKKPEEIKFQPLEFPKEITGRQILSQHPTGREFAHLLKDAEVFPIFIDSSGQILSMPPIINSHQTGKITENTKDIFIECTGNNLPFLKKALNIMVTALAESGGKICSVQLIDCNKKFVSPDLKPQKIEFSIEKINKVLGLSLKEKQIQSCLSKMGHSFLKQKNKTFAKVPCYRTDILHEIDLAEEAAISYGYENLIPEIPKISTIGKEDDMAILKRKISEILIGLNLTEVSTYHLTTKHKQFKKLGIKEFKFDILEVLDSKTENNILRNTLLSQSIEVLSKNTDATYPQNIFELGKVFITDKNCETWILEPERLCVCLCSEKANFTEIKQILDYLMRMLNLEYHLKESEYPLYIPGRCGEIIIKNKSVGFIGEISPIIIRNAKIKMPIANLEIQIREMI
jgi:phenylalanyl-tRNA synthetase beta chain